MSLSVEACTSPNVAGAAAEHSRQLRSRGITTASRVDVLVAAFCIEHEALS